MIKMINRLLEPTDGNIYMDGNVSRTMMNGSYVSVPAMSFKPLPYFPNLTVAENIALIPEDEGAGLKNKSLLRQKNSWIGGAPCYRVYKSRMPSEAAH